MNIQAIIQDIRTSITETFSAIDTWFDRDTRLRNYKPLNGGWSINEILEHIGLTNHFLLILIDKGTKKALHNVHQMNLEVELQNHVFHWDKLTEVGLHQSFDWMRPEHMEPTGKKPLQEVRNELQEQAGRCISYLELLKNGEGVLYRTTMSVNNLGKIDVYEYIYFLVQHGRRHIMQMERVEAEYSAEEG